MSVKAMTHVWDNYKTGGSKKLVMLAIADSCNDMGECYPGVERIAEKSCMTKRYAQKILRELETDGDIRIDTNGGMDTGHGSTNRYYMTKYRQSIGIERGELSDTPSVAGVNNRTSQGVNSDSRLGVNNRTSKPSVEPSVEHIADGKIIPMAKSKKEPSLPDGLYEAVKDVFGYQGGMNIDYQKMLIGTATKKQYEPYNMAKDNPVLPDELRAWCKWYRAVELGGNTTLTMVKSPAKVQSSILKYRDIQAHKLTAIPQQSGLTPAELHNLWMITGQRNEAS